jgi:hypothetical protein
MTKIDTIIDVLEIAANEVESAYVASHIEEALAAARELKLELAKQEFYPDWDMLKPFHERIAELEAQLAKPEMPTKIFGPNLEQILNAAGFYRRDAVCCGDYEKCIEPCTPKGEWLAKKELAKPEQEKPEWQELYKDEIKEILNDGEQWSAIEFAQAVSDALREKNGG